MEEVVKPILKPASGGPTVIIDDGSESIKARALSGNEDILPTIAEPVKGPGSGIEFGGETAALHHKIACILVGEVLGSLSPRLVSRPFDRLVSLSNHRDQRGWK